MIKYYYRNGNGKDKEIKELESYRIGSWIYVEDPTREEINQLVEEFDLEEGHLHDALDEYEVPRLETEGKTKYIFYRFVYSEGSAVETAPILFIINDKFFITLSKEPLPFLKKFLAQSLPFQTKQSTKLLLQLIFQINTTYNTMLNNISKRVRGLSVRLENFKNQDILQFVKFESILNEFMSNLVPNNTVLHQLFTRKNIVLDEDDKDLVEDILLSTNQLMEISRSNIKNIVNLREAYSTIMTNNLNRVIKLFTSLTVLLTIPTIISSIYGMNVNLPFDQSPFAFMGIIIIIIAISSALFYLFNKRQWL
jgi:magnesium transporter